MTSGHHVCYTDIIRRLSQPLAPIPTTAEPKLGPLAGVRAVLFDVYGTLLVSASGDISLAAGASRGGAMDEALAAVGIKLTVAGEQAVDALHGVIGRRNAELGLDYPEVEIRDVWRDALEEWTRTGWIEPPAGPIDVERLAIDYEMRVNPVWPMPGAVECLAAIRKAGLWLGIVSNAQFFTPLLFPALMDKSLEERGFAPELRCWSYEHRRAKPGAFLYEKAAAALLRHGISPSEALYVGNDMRNDIAPAARVGFRTVLFAGDARSLRLREGDPLVAGVSPDRTATDLRQIISVLRLAAG